MNPISERRVYPRRASYIVADYTVSEGTFRDIIKNIGPGGLFIGTWRKISVGQPIVVQFPLFQFDHTIQVTGTVVRTEAKGFAVVFGKPIQGLICKDGLLPEIVHEADRSS